MLSDEEKDMLEDYLLGLTRYLVLQGFLSEPLDDGCEPDHIVEPK